MDPRPGAAERLTPEAAEFIRFCFRRRPVGWPDLYDEMCLVASRGLFRGWGPDDLADQGVGFGLLELPALAALAQRIVAEEQAARRAAVGRGRGTVVHLAPEGSPGPGVDAERGPTHGLRAVAAS
jgi:hypothetical protein